MATKRAATKKAPKKRAPKAATALSAHRYPTYTGLTASEEAFLNELIDKGRALEISTEKAVDVEVYVQDSTDRSGKARPAFTIALFYMDEGVSVGVSKLNASEDQWDKQRGRLIALARAARGEAVKV